jgi:hypothetical protein
MSEEPTGKAKGGKAAAEKLTPEQRKERARNAAQSRWSGNLPQASHEGEFPIGESMLACANLPDGTRIITQATFLRAIGRSRSPKAGTGVLSTVDSLPFFLQANTLKPFISEELAMSTAPIFYRTKKGGKGVGYDATLLPKVAEVYLKYRDDCMARNKEIPNQYEHIVKAADVLMRGLAHIGIIALVDEATGYQEIRDKQALQAILDSFLRKELAAWAKRFPDEFYEHIFRLRGWEWKGRKVNPPQILGYYTTDIVYERLAPHIVEELEKRNPVENGKRKVKHHQWLTDDVGHPALAQHLYAIITLMRVSKTWEQFKQMLDFAHPKKGDNLQLPFMASYLPTEL